MSTLRGTRKRCSSESNYITLETSKSCGLLPIHRTCISLGRSPPSFADRPRRAALGGGEGGAQKDRRGGISGAAHSAKATRPMGRRGPAAQIFEASTPSCQEDCIYAAAALIPKARRHNCFIASATGRQHCLDVKIWVSHGTRLAFC